MPSLKFAYRLAGEDVLDARWDEAKVRRMLRGEEDLPFEHVGSSSFASEAGERGVPQRLHSLIKHLLRRNPMLRMASEDVRAPLPCKPATQPAVAHAAWRPMRLQNWQLL